MYERIRIEFIFGYDFPYLEFRCHDLFMVATILCTQSTGSRIDIETLVRAASLLTIGGANSIVRETATNYFTPVYENVGQTKPLDATLIRAIGGGFERQPNGPLSLQKLAEVLCEFDPKSKAVWEQLIEMECSSHAIHQTVRSDIAKVDPVDLKGKVLVLFQYGGWPVTAVFNPHWNEDNSKNSMFIEGSILTPRYGGTSSRYLKGTISWPISASIKHQIIPESDWPAFSQGLWQNMPTQPPKWVSVKVDLLGLDSHLNDLIINSLRAKRMAKDRFDLADVLVFAESSIKHNEMIRAKGFKLEHCRRDLESVPGGSFSSIESDRERFKARTDLLVVIAKAIELSNTPMVSLEQFLHAILEFSEVSGAVKISRL